MRPCTTFVRPLTDDVRRRRHDGLQSPVAFTLRRCQILRASSNGHTPAHIAALLGCTPATVRNAIHAFATQGLDCLHEQSSRPKTVQPLLATAFDEPLRELLHHSPRLYGKARSTWTLALLAQVCFEKGWTPRLVSIETIRHALERLRISWKRAKHWIRSPDPAYTRKKQARDRLIRLAQSHPDWVLGFQDECWWSRLAQPTLDVWVAGEPLQLVEKAVASDDPDPKALACYGLLRYDTGAMLVRFVAGRPVSQVTEDYLLWVCGQLAREGKKALLLVWDNATWHVSGRVRSWIKAHNRRVKQEGGVRIVLCRLPSKSPWLNPIEAKWLHGKKAVAEPERVLSAAEVQARVCAYYGCAPEELLQQTDPPKKKPKRKKVA
jgi:transposase